MENNPTHQQLRDDFENVVLLNGEEVDANARELLEDIESQGRGCRPGAYGRKLQFADPDFPPDNASVGNAKCRQQLATQWKVRENLKVTCLKFYSLYSHEGCAALDSVRAVVILEATWLPGVHLCTKTNSAVSLSICWWTPPVLEIHFFSPFFSFEQREPTAVS